MLGRWIVASCLLAPLAAQASTITLVTSRSSLAGAQVADWAGLGPAGTSIPQPFTMSTDHGFQFTVLKNNSPTNYLRADEGNGFRGDFLPGESLLYSTSQTAFDLRFPQPIMAIGGQLQKDVSGSWTPFVWVFTSDGGNKSFQLAVDTNNKLEDGSAPFVGVTSDGATITRVLFDSYYGGNTAIGDLSIVVPEPGTLGLLAVGLALAATRRRGRPN